MSHFTVMVIGDNVEEQLAPYQENNMGDCPEEYISFIDQEEEKLNNYKTRTTERVKTPDGRVLSPYDEEFKVRDTSKNYESYSYAIPNDCKKIEVPFTEIYKTFEEYMSDYGYEARDEKTNRYGYWDNPNKKWDWYQIGGRWTGFFKLKSNDVPYKIGNPGILTGMCRDGYADSALKKYIDFEGMRQEEASKAKWKYQTVAKFFGGAIPKIEYKWSDFFCENGEFKDLDIEEKREKYHKQEPISRLKNSYEEIKLLPEKEKDLLLWIDIEDYQCTEEEYITKAKNAALSTFALVKDGKWYEKGQMGWWACVSNKKDEQEWNEEFSKLLDSVSDDTLLTVVDCHI